MKSIWHYLMNVFDNVTAGSFRLALRISLVHLGALKSKISIALILGLYNDYLLVHDTYENAYNVWKVAYAKQQSQTQGVSKALKKLSGTKARNWDTGIQQVYDVDSDEYKALLPNGRTPFQQGSQTDRKAAVKTLSDAIGGDLTLAIVKADVDAFYILLNKALLEQKAAITNTETASTACEKARKIMCMEQFGDLGALMQFYKATPVEVESFFDLKVLRNGLQVLFMGHVKKLGLHTIVQRTILATDQLSLENTGVTELRFYLSATKDGVIGTTFIAVAAGKTLTVSASDMGDVTLQHFLMVYNPDTINKGEFTVEFL